MGNTSFPINSSYESSTGIASEWYDCRFIAEIFRHAALLLYGMALLLHLSVGQDRRHFLQ